MSRPDVRPVTAAERTRHRARAALADDAPDVLDRVRSELDALVARAQDAGYVVPLAWLTQVNRHLDDLGDLLTRPDDPPALTPPTDDPDPDRGGRRRP